MQKKVISFDKTKINYDIRKKYNFYLIFVHGLGGDLTVWKKERAFFYRKGFSTIAIDLRGHGLSGRPKFINQYEIDSYAKDIFYVIKKEKVKNFFLIAHCFGGIVITSFHKLYPKAAKGYILIDSTCKGHPSLKILFKHPPTLNLINMILESKDLRSKRLFHRNYDRFEGTGDWNIRRITSDIMQASLKSWFFAFEHLANFNGIKVLKKMDKPVLIIQGEKDSIFPLRTAVKLHKLIKNSELYIIPKANHQVTLNNTKDLKVEILNYLSKIRGYLKLPKQIIT